MSCSVQTQRSARGSLLACITASLLIFSTAVRADGALLMRQASPAELNLMPFSSAQELSKLRAQRLYKSVTAVKVDTAAFSGTILNISLPTRMLRVVGAPQASNSFGQYIWSARPDNEVLSAIFSVDGSNVYGSIHTKDGAFEIRTLPNGTQVVLEVDSQAANSAVDTIAPPPTAPSSSGSQPTSSIDSSPPSPLAAGAISNFRPIPQATSGTIVRILVAYSQGAASALGSGLQGAIATAIQQINQANTASGVAFTAVLAGTVPVTYSGPYDSHSTLLAFEAMPSVRTAHDSMGADMMIMLENLTANTDAGEAAGINVTADHAFAVVSTSYMTSNLSFAHEIGHLMGADHAQLDSSGGPFLRGHGAWAYQWVSVVDLSHGYCMHSVMAYAIAQSNDAKTNLRTGYTCINDPRMDVWSNTVNSTVIPMANVAVTLGSGFADNASVLNVTAPGVAQFHLTQLVPPVRRPPSPPPNCSVNPRACA
jgi:peptidyl-Asp metalloendopeptidase